MTTSFLSMLAALPDGRVLAQQQKYAPCFEAGDRFAGMRPVQGSTWVLEVSDERVTGLVGKVAWPEQLQAAAVLSVNVCGDVWYVKGALPAPAGSCTPVLSEWKVRWDEASNAVHILQEYSTASSTMSRFENAAYSWSAEGQFGIKDDGIRELRFPLPLYEVTRQAGEWVFLGGVFGFSQASRPVQEIDGLRREQLISVPRNGAWIYRTDADMQLYRACRRKQDRCIPLRARSVSWDGRRMVLSMGSARDASLIGAEATVHTQVEWELMLEASNVIVPPEGSAPLPDLQQLVDDFFAGRPAEKLHPLHAEFLQEEKNLDEDCTQCERSSLRNRYVLRIRDICLKKM